MNTHRLKKERRQIRERMRQIDMITQTERQVDRQSKSQPASQSISQRKTVNTKRRDNDKISTSY